MTPYLSFALTAADTILTHQSARPERPEETAVFVTGTPWYARAWCSVGLQPDGRYESIPVPEVLLDPRPRMLDLTAWPWLEQLADMSGDASYRRRVEDMASCFARHGFAPRCGLAYVGAGTQFDVVRLCPAPIRGYERPMFKPMPLPLERLWQTAPHAMTRLFKAAFYGLVTRPSDMAFNRYCYYDFDDRARQPSLPFDCGHVGFASSAAWLIEWWAFAFAQTGDEEFLAWAQAMTDKWRAAQDARTGLIPHWFGSPTGGATQPPRPFACVKDGGTATTWLQAAAWLDRRPAGRALAQQVAAVGRRLIVGLATGAYDEPIRRFHEWLRLTDGRPDTEAVFYYFPSAAAKAEAVRHDPILNEGAVFEGEGFFRASPSAHACGDPLAAEIADAALVTGDPVLLERSRFFADRIREAAAALTGPWNAEGQWTFPAVGDYIRQALAVHRLTGAPRYLDQARWLADREIAWLARPLPPDKPDWWRLPQRGRLLTALLALHRAVTAT